MCPGQVLGVRMGMLGLALLGFEAPLNDRDIKKVVVVVEIDRCAADALAAVTGVKLGRRSLKFMDYGLMAASFYNLKTGDAYRVSVDDACKQAALRLRPDMDDPAERETAAYSVMPASELFRVEKVAVHLQPEDLPGYRGDKAACDACGAVIRHCREVVVEGKTLCRACAGPAYFERVCQVDGFDRVDPAASS
jgi:formylmethanofuran dehydrogenase subunit E